MTPGPIRLDCRGIPRVTLTGDYSREASTVVLIRIIPRLLAPDVAHELPHYSGQAPTHISCEAEYPENPTLGRDNAFKMTGFFQLFRQLHGMETPTD